MSTKHAARLRLVFAALVAAGAVGVALLAPRGPGVAVAAQKDAPGAAKDDPLRPKTFDDVGTGFVACRACHNEKDLPIDPKENDFARLYKSHEFVFLSEGRTWRRQDPHSSAFKVLTEPLGQQMAKILKYDVTKAPQCLTCHGIDKMPGAPMPKEEAAIAKRFDAIPDEGVTCAVCHGLRTKWQGDHFKAVGGAIPWRTMTPADKEAAGMRNLRDPVVKAELCASCHVGDPDLHRVVTHDIYAAGHPPLPPFEIGTFMLNEPMHWGASSGGYPSDDEPKGAKDGKDKKGRDSVRLNFFTEAEFTKYPGGAEIAKKDPNWMWTLYRTHPEKDEVSLARAITAGAIASLHAEMKLIAADAESVLAGTEGAVDFARFDCYACHHDLKYPSDRQKRGYAWAPGRVPLKAWTAALPGIVAEHAATTKAFANEAKGFQAKWDAAQTAATVRPFGRPKDLAPAARDMAAWCETFMKKDQAEATPIYTKDEATKLLAAMSKGALAKWSADPEAAMHITWAYLSLRDHMREKPDEKALDALRAVLPVQVREPQKEGMYKGTFSNNMGDPLTVGDTLRQRLDLFNKFNATEYRKAFGALTGAPPK